MYIVGRIEPDGSIYIDKTFLERFGKGQLDHYDYQPVHVPGGCEDCQPSDFVHNGSDIFFSIDNYNQRKRSEQNLQRIAEIKSRLAELSQDFIQATAGAQFPDIESRINEFQALHNELRSLLGKEPRVYR